MNTADLARIELARELGDRLNPDDLTLESRVGASLGWPDGTAESVLRQRGWYPNGDGWVCLDMDGGPRTVRQALGNEYLRGLAADPARWDKVLAFNRDGKRVITAVGLFPRGADLGPTLAPDALARSAGALLAAYDRLQPRTAWGRRSPVRAHLEALARAHLPHVPVEPLDSPIAPSYLATFGTTLE